MMKHFGRSGTTKRKSAFSYPKRLSLDLLENVPIRSVEGETFALKVARYSICMSLPRTMLCHSLLVSNAFILPPCLVAPLIASRCSLDYRQPETSDYATEGFEAGGKLAIG